MVALVISVAITSVFYFRVVRQQGGSRSKTKRVVAAAAALQPGTAVAQENITEIDWPQSVQLEGLIERREDVVGRVLIYPVGANEPLLKRDLASEGSFGLAAKIPTGMRAMAVKTNEVTTLGALIFPGSRVDVLVTLRGDSNIPPSTRTVLQNVPVLSTGPKIEPDPQGKTEKFDTVTLLVTPEESEKLALAQNQGSIQFVLRNGSDSARLETVAVELTELLGKPKKPPEAVTTKPRKAAAAVKPPAVYTVETVAGGKSSVAKFEAPPR